MDNLTGQSVGHYHIIEQLGKGGMASVYRAYDIHVSRDVAIKFIRRDAVKPELQPDMLKRFEDEAKVLEQLDHPNIIKIYETGVYEGSPYLVMQYINNGTLKNLMGKPMPYADAARLLIPIAHALEYAHKHNLVHRDVKPANILITKDGVPVLSDFGVARVIEPERLPGTIQIRVGMGTPGYMAPEMAGIGEVDYRADIYSLGVIFYQLVTGRKPFEADTPLAVVLKHINEPLPRPKSFVPDLPDTVEQAIFKALAKQPEDRYQDMATFAGVLEKLSQEKVKPVLPVQTPEDSVVIPPAREAIPPVPLPPAAKKAVSTPAENVKPPVQPPPQSYGVPGKKARGGSSVWTPVIVVEIVILVCLFACVVTIIGYGIIRVKRAGTRQFLSPPEATAIQTVVPTFPKKVVIPPSPSFTPSVSSTAKLTFTWTPTSTPTCTVTASLTQTSSITPAGSETLAETAALTDQTASPVPQGTGTVETAPRMGYRAPDFSLMDTNGEQISLSDSTGKPVLLVFFATWCPHCQAEAPRIKAVYDKYNENGLVILAVNTFINSGDDAKAFAQDHGWAFSPLIDSDGTATDLYQVSGVPTNFFINKAGIIQYIGVGEMDQALMVKYIGDMMQ